MSQPIRTIQDLDSEVNGLFTITRQYAGMVEKLDSTVRDLTSTVNEQARRIQELEKAAINNDFSTYMGKAY